MDRIGERMAVSAAKQRVAKVRQVRTIQEFKAFIMKGNVLDLAVGIIIGVAFGAVVSSMVNDVLMPPIGVALGGVDFKEAYVVLKPSSDGNWTFSSLAAANAAGAVTWRYGSFVNAIINFVIVAFAVFMMIRTVARLRDREEVRKGAAPTETECPFCLLKVPLKAVKCGHCTSELPAAPAPG